MLALAPVPLGSVGEVPQAVLQSGAWTLVFLLGSAWVGGKLRLRPVPVPVLAAWGLVAYGLLQLVPFFGAPVALDPHATRMAVLATAAHAVFFTVWFQTPWREDERRRLTIFLIAWGATLACLGLVQRLTWNGKLFWIIDIEAGAMFGPFVNRNHFAGFVELLIPPALIQAMSPRNSRRIRAVAWGGFVVMTAAVLVTGSRGGILASATGAAVAAWLWKARSPNLSLKRKIALAGVSAACVSLIGVIGVAGPGFSDRPGDEAAPSRIQIWTSSIEAARASFPWGVGLGGFAVAFPRFDSSDGTYRVEHAHNDYLEGVVETGIVGAAGGLLFAAGFLATTWRLLKSNAEGMPDASLSKYARAAGGAAACGAMLVHALFDFNLRIPSNALLFLAMAAAALWDGDDR